jgi:hypothetical protein
MIYTGPTCTDLILHTCRDKLLCEAEGHVNNISPDNDLTATPSLLQSLDSREK